MNRGYTIRKYLRGESIKKTKKKHEGRPYRCVVKRKDESTGCLLNIVFFPDIFILIFFSVSLGGSVCTHTRQVEHKRCSRTGRVQKNHFKENHNI